MDPHTTLVCISCIRCSLTITANIKNISKLDSISLKWKQEGLAKRYANALQFCNTCCIPAPICRCITGTRESSRHQHSITVTASHRQCIGYLQLSLDVLTEVRICYIKSPNFFTKISSLYDIIGDDVNQFTPFSSCHVICRNVYARIHTLPPSCPLT